MLRNLVEMEKSSSAQMAQGESRGRLMEGGCRVGGPEAGEGCKKISPKSIKITNFAIFT